MTLYLTFVFLAETTKTQNHVLKSWQLIFIKICFFVFVKLFILIIEPTYIIITFTLHFVNLSLINTNWLIFIVLNIISYVICYFIIILTFIRFFILYFFERDFFNASIVFILSNTNRKLSIYIYIILISSSLYLIRMLGSLFSWTNPIFL